MDIEVLLDRLEMATQWGLKPEHREVAIALIVAAQARLSKMMVDDEAEAAYWAKPPLYRRLHSARLVLTDTETNGGRDVR